MTAPNRGLRAIALFEATKGFLVLAVGAGALSLLNRDAAQVAERLVRHLQLDPTAHYAGIFLKLAGRVNNADLWFIAATAFGYGVIRFIEAYGLWNARTWAEWVAVISGALYIPIELMGIWRHVTWLKISILALNVVVVLYVAKLLIESRRAKTLARSKS